MSGRCTLRPEAQQRLKRSHRRASAVESKHELVDVVGQVLRADTVVGSIQPDLEVREGPVNARKQFGRILRITDRRGPIIVPLTQSSVAWQPIREQRTAWLDRTRD